MTGDDRKDGGGGPIVRPLVLCLLAKPSVSNNTALAVAVAAPSSAAASVKAAKTTQNNDMKMEGPHRVNNKIRYSEETQQHKEGPKS